MYCFNYQNEGGYKFGGINNTTNPLGERASMAGEEGKTERHGRHVREQGECGPECGPIGHPSQSRAAKTEYKA